MKDTSWQAISSPLQYGQEHSPLLRMLARWTQSVCQWIPRDILVVGGAALLLGVAGIVWHHRLAERVFLLSAQVYGLEQNWQSLQSDQEDGKRLQAYISATLDKTRRVAEEKGSDQWTPALRSIASSVGPDIELRVIHLWKNPDDPAGRLLRVEGVTLGAGPRAITDEFLFKLHKELQQHFQLKTEPRIERLEDAPGQATEKPGPQSSAFVLVAAIGAPLPASATTQPKR